MSFPTPSLKELIDQVDADVAAELQGGGKLLRRSFLRAVARAQAGLAFLMFGFLRRYLDNALPWSAKGVWLYKWASWWSGFSPKAATSAAGVIDITGTNGAVLAQGTLYQDRSGKTYETQAEATIAAGVASVQVAATEAGTIGNLEAGTTLSLVSPVAGISSAAIVAVGGLTNGTDIESEEDFRSRWQLHVQRRGNGVLEADFVQLATEIAGVTRAWAYGNRDGAGTVAVFFVRDNDPVTIIPDAAAVASMQEYLSSPVRKPICIAVNAYAPVALPLNLTIRVIPDTPAVREQVEREIGDLISREAVVGTTIPLSHIDEAISLSVGETDHFLLSPTSALAVAVNEILVLGTITWV